jgi:hypothetical protein
MSCMCDCCGGSGTPVSGKPCICGGQGTCGAERVGLRTELHKLQEEYENLRGLHRHASERCDMALARAATSEARAEQLEQRVFDERCPEWFRVELHGLADQAGKCHWHNVVFRLIDILSDCRKRLAKGLREGSVRDEMNEALVAEKGQTNGN